MEESVFRNAKERESAGLEKLQAIRSQDRRIAEWQNRYSSMQGHLGSSILLVRENERIEF